MSRMTSEEIRADFLQFFEEKKHTVVESAPLVPDHDPTLLFVNAGMNQFKDVFLGTGNRPYERAVDSQKCLRVSGKHNDLEEVGHDTYHHTFFEMLGNWSFGDYFKKEAVRYAWELLTEHWELDPDRLYATVHEGDEALGLDADTDAARFWKSETGIDPDHVLFEPSKENFWMMGDTGPCGPCSEVHVDLRSEDARRKQPGVSLVNADHPQVMEIWNLVFIQFDAQSDGSLTPLPSQHVDTGMGFERMVAVLQDKASTYDTDLFAPLLQAACDLAPLATVHGYDHIDVDDPTERERIRVALRVVADHVRTGAFAIADGVSPGNEGRNYVIRRILRRAVRYGYQTLELREPFLCHLVRSLVEKMGDHFDELADQQSYIEQVIRSEEEAFLQTLGTGINFFERLMPYMKNLATTEEAPHHAEQNVLEQLRADAKALDLLDKAYVDTVERSAMLEGFSEAAARHEIPGAVAFLLHDTYGFPIDLTRLMAREEGFDVDMERYEALMQEQRDRARAASSFATDHDADWQTVSEGPDSAFVGYDQLTLDDAKIRAVRAVDAAKASNADDSTVGHEVILDRTPFYAESGGQIGDSGTLTIGDETFHVTDVQKHQDAIVHTIAHLPAQPEAPVRAEVDAERRRRTAAHHTATHLLHAALRETLGDHVQQKGSLVTPERLRFDFSHHQGLTPETLSAIEQQVNDAIQRNIPRREDRDVPIEEAKERGAMALFGEKYGERVRVVTFDPAYSVELCGGTHAGSTGELGLFRFLSESSVAAGVRRVEAVAGPAALEHVQDELSELGRVRGQLRASGTPPSEQIQQLQAENQQLKSELGTLKQQQLQEQLSSFIEDARPVGEAQVVTGHYDKLDMDALQQLGNTLRERLGADGVGVLGANAPDGEKVYLVVSVGDTLIERGLQAGELAGVLAQRVGGGGGGRPTLASAGGREPDKLNDALEATAGEVRERL